jgi:hypothetical protein
MGSEIENELVDAEELLLRPGTYFNPHTEVVVIVDDSSSIDQGLLYLEGHNGNAWIRLSELAPVDEQALEEALEEFQTGLGVNRAETVALEPAEDDIDDPELPPSTDDAVTEGLDDDPEPDGLAD